MFLSFEAESFVFQFTIQNMKIKIYTAIILSVVLYGSETWSVILRNECGLRVFEDWILRRIFKSQKNEVNRSLEKTS